MFCRYIYISIFRNFDTAAFRYFDTAASKKLDFHSKIAIISAFIVAL